MVGLTGKKPKMVLEKKARQPSPTIAGSWLRLALSRMLNERVVGINKGRYKYMGTGEETGQGASQWCFPEGAGA